MATLTGANSIIMLGIPLLFPIPQQLQGFATDDVFNTDAIESAETLMGVDGNLSGGYVNVPVKQNYILQGDSKSNAFFDNWFEANKTAQDSYTASGTIVLTSIGKKYNMVRGFLTNYTPIPAVKKLIQPRTHTITWESSSPASA